MRNSIQRVNREYTGVTRVGSVVPADFAHWETARLISNRSSANWRNTVIKDGPYWSGSAVSKMRKTGQRREQCLSGIISSVLQKGHLMILRALAAMKN